MQALLTLHLDTLQGGMVVDTPSDHPILRSIIQFDGDIQTIIFYREDQPDAPMPPGILAAHASAMARRIGWLANWQNRANMAGRLAQALTAGGSATAILAALIHHTALHIAALELAAALLPLSLKRAAPMVLQAVFARAARQAAPDRRQRNQHAIAQLRR